MNLRSIEIVQRQNNFLKSNLCRTNKEFLDSLKATPNSICFGSAWPEDVQVLAHKDLVKSIKQTRPWIFIFPHSFEKSIIDEMTSILHKSNLGYKKVFSLKDLTVDDKGTINIIMVKGVLCELSSFFNYSVVGGGFGVSVHSVLEPMIGKCHTLTGPNVNRSTEVEEFCSQYPGKINVCNEAEEISFFF